MILVLWKSYREQETLEERASEVARRDEAKQERSSPPDRVSNTEQQLVQNISTNVCNSDQAPPA